MDDFDDIRCDDEYGQYEDDLSDWEEAQVFADHFADLGEHDYESPLMGPDGE